MADEKQKAVEKICENCGHFTFFSATGSRWGACGLLESRKARMASFDTCKQFTHLHAKK